MLLRMGDVRVKGSAALALLLLHSACAITGRIEGEFDKRKEASLLPNGFNDQNRFALNTPIQNFNQQLNSNPTSQSIFQQPIFPPQNPPTYVPQVPIGSPQIFGGNQNPIVPNNVQFPSIQFNQPQNLPTLIPNHFPSSSFGQNPNIIQNFAPQSNLGQQFTPQNFNHNSQFPQTVNIPQPRPTNAAFLPTLPTVQSTFSQPDPIRINPAPNLNPISQGAPNNFNHQVSFQSSLGQSPLFTNGQSSHIQSLFEQQNKENLERLKELQERDRIIQKHKQFVERQQQKQQDKVEKLHEDFVSRQAKKPEFVTTESYDELLQSKDPAKQRTIYPHEAELFRKAVQMYDDLHPTTTTTTTTTTTPQPTTSRFKPRPKLKPRTPLPENKQKLYNDIKSLLEESETKGFDDEKIRAKSIALLQKPDILKQIKLAIAENPEDFNEKNFSTREISLPNGQKFEIIRTTNPNLIPNGAITADGTTLSHTVTPSPTFIRQSKLNFEDLTKGVLPPGADFELIKQSDNGKLEEVDKSTSDLQNKKKVTFVFLEEQDDGSYKVKGVKANGQQTEEGPDVENILNKIKKGEIQLPAPTKATPQYVTSTTASPSSMSSSIYPNNFFSHVTTSNHGSTGHTTPNRYSTTPAPTNSVYRATSSSTGGGTYITNHGTTYNTKTTRPQINYSTGSTKGVTSTERTSAKSTQNTYIPTRSSHSPSTRDLSYSSSPSSTPPSFRPSEPPLIVIGSSTARPEEAGSNINYARESSPGLVEILKENGLFATAKYLRQSGLDSILNETGPYTIFAPTDKAFRTLLVQLGGPDKAEEKFKDNPRLLSGLLLHHVIPGAFDIASLQDEMTGVSLAGTQLRVNQYDMHDVEWNEIRVTTINGARVVEEKKDINIPQGVAHAVDRVMFPLPVGDLVQTLQADRDRRFTTFLKTLYTSGFAEILSESKTYTVFAPTDAAFARLSGPEMAKLGDRAAARAFVARHVLPGTLYSAGMRYYQLRNSMEESKPLTLQKNAGRIKVNNAQVITHNIPATNGVIHAVDTIIA